jgi:lipid II:glycine glycyltransferase (peptidoglycan interpeptide bridge formation enzyme)
MDFIVLNCSDHGKWNSYLEKIPDERKSPHFSPEYYELFEQRREGRAICFIGEEKDKIMLYPTLINSINELGFELDGTYYDLQGAYGYNGPITNCSDEDFLNKFSNSLLDYCRQSRVIAEFIRFCPVIRNQGYLNYIQPLYNLDNVLLDLTPGIDHIWKNCFDNGVRKAIRKIAKTNLFFKIIAGGDVAEEDITNFLDIYNETMSRNNADDYYFFSKSFIHRFFADMPKQTLLTFILLDGKAISTELVLLNSHHAYGFLGGTLAEYYLFNPNSFLRFELIKYLFDQGIKTYSIGGGKTKGDSVYLFKKSFSRNSESRFYIGKFIHNENIYNKIIEQWSCKFPEKVIKYNKFLLKYRY